MHFVKMVLTATLLAVMPAQAADLSGWRLVWADEFSQADGSAPSPTNWVYDLGGDGWGNNELETYTNRRENSRIEKGVLVIEARKETFTGGDNKARDYTSARLKTAGRQAWTHGRLEARMKIPRGQGIWPAFWTLGANAASAGWPKCGEIDIMENIGKEPMTVHGTIHGPGYSGAGGIGGLLTIEKPLADEFHLYAIEWTTNRIDWFLDDRLYFSVAPARLPKGKTWVYDKPQFIILNLAVGGSWPGNPDPTTTFPQQLLIDYVRVYARTNAPLTNLNP